MKRRASVGIHERADDLVTSAISGHGHGMQGMDFNAYAVPD